MTARKPKPKPRKASGPTLEQRVATIERFCLELDGWHERHIDSENRNFATLQERLDALESRANLRNKSHDEPVSNAGEAIGQHYRIVDEIRAPWWRRLIGFMGAP